MLPNLVTYLAHNIPQCVTCNVTVDKRRCCEKKPKLNRYGMYKLFVCIISVSLTRIAFKTAPRTLIYSGSSTTKDFLIGLQSLTEWAILRDVIEKEISSRATRSG